MAPDGSRGIALVSVLWVAMLLALLAAGLTSSSRTESRLARNRVENARAEALANAGVHRAVQGLLEFDPARTWRADGTEYRFRLAGGRVRVVIEDEDAKVDLNTAPLELLAGLLRAVGLAEDAAQAQAERIVDFRDEDFDPLPLGAEDDAYAAAGLGQGAKDGPFFATSELLDVLGMTRQLYRRLRRHVTVFSGSEGIDPLRASRTVLAAVPGMTPEAIEKLAAAGPRADPFMLLDEELLFELELYFLFSREVMYTVRAQARSEGGGVFVREALVELTGDEVPFDLHVWRRGERLGVAAAR